VEGFQSPNYRVQLAELATIATETEHLDCRLNLEANVPQLDKFLHQWLQQVLSEENAMLLQNFIELFSAIRRLHISIQGDRLQEQYALFLREQWVPRVMQSTPESTGDTTMRVDAFVKLGQLLAIEMRPWLTRLQYSGT
jgi:hypothetical protein